MFLSIDEFNLVKTRIDAFPTIFLPKNMARKIGTLAVARYNKNAAVVSVLPADFVVRKDKINNVALNQSARELFGGSGDILLERIDPETTVFVCGVELSNYWNPFTCELNEGALSKLPHIRGILGGFSLLWQKEEDYPVLVKSNGVVLGELYPNALDDFIRYYDPPGGHQVQKSVKIIPAENMICAGPTYAKIYNSVGRRSDGLKVASIRYPDSYSVCRHLFSYFEFSKDLYIRWIVGNLPVMITAPHGGLLRPANLPTGRGPLGDSFTLEIAEGIIRRTFELSDWCLLPSAVISRAYRNFVELNRPNEPQDGYAKRVYREYHESILRIVEILRKLGRGVLILDIHGMRNLGLDIVLGTDYGKSIRGFEDRYVELRRTLEKEFSVGVNDFGLAGRYTVTRYSSLVQVGAIQIEASLNVRIDPLKRAKLIDLIAEYLIGISNIA